jgi:hypothetical protein
MRNLLIGTAAALSLLSGPASLGAAQAEPSAQLLLGGDRLDQPMNLEQIQFFFSGQNYCWYVDGWHGPGYYYCGYAWRRGYGWGGPRGWHGWTGHGGGGHGGFGHGGHGRAGVGGGHGQVGEHAAPAAGGHMSAPAGHMGGGGAHMGGGGAHGGGGGHGGGGDHR